MPAHQFREALRNKECDSDSLRLPQSMMSILFYANDEAFLDSGASLSLWQNASYGKMKEDHAVGEVMQQEVVCRLS